MKDRAGCGRNAHGARRRRSARCWAAGIGVLRARARRSLAASALLAAVAAALGIGPALGPSPAGAEAHCVFQLGFRAIAEAIPQVVGACVEDERFNPENGNAEQRTAGGLLVWRKADNWTAFTDGHRTWINGPRGLAERLNTERFAWEVDPALASAAGAPDAPGVAYIALGDSIAVGRTLTTTYGYVSQFRDHLQSVHGNVFLANRAANGARSGDLLAQLRHDSGIRLAVANAQVLTISIGGNNLLGCASNGYQTLDTTCGAGGAAAFGEDWPRILSEIRHGIGSTARLYVMTLYNPYRGDEPNYAVADEFIRQINGHIENETYAGAHGYEVVDVYSAYSGQASDGTWKVCLWTYFCGAGDPHPTDSGQREIARGHEMIYH